ncbi:hypothetical protein RJ640_014248 [Escallonia rubra]|uniref:Uncharacterized protein n=1 Tax=Escallonia rubra TaxID=112253 RepID=A0AA88QXL1_9ASTE|nr:hypothetical protein RJ640_014248 [Escallonia rubra]
MDQSFSLRPSCHFFAALPPSVGYLNSALGSVIRCKKPIRGAIEGVLNLFLENVLAKRYEGQGLSVNCFCPGFTQTSMTHVKGTHTADDAVDLGARLALLPPEQLPTGKFYLGSSQL